MVPEARGVFPGLMVQEILALGIWSVGVPEAERARRVDWVMQVLPPIRAFYDKRADLLSAGQQQMGVDRAGFAGPAALSLYGRAVDRAGAQAVAGSVAAEWHPAATATQ